MNLANLAVNARSLMQLAAAVALRVPTTGPTKSADLTVKWLTENIGETVGAGALSAEPQDGNTGTTDFRRGSTGPRRPPRCVPCPQHWSSTSTSTTGNSKSAQ